MSHGTPVIASDIPIFREVGHDAVSYVHPDSPSEFADAVRRLEEPEVWKAHSLRSVERAAEFSWDHSARQLVQLAEEAARINRR
jgi:glycosyltransferase involved in cell wall biosynthesis